MKTVFSAMNITMINKLKHFMPHLVVNHLETEQFLFLLIISMVKFYAKFFGEKTAERDI
jgi:hypothetical protein